MIKRENLKCVVTEVLDTKPKCLVIIIKLIHKILNVSG